MSTPSGKSTAKDWDQVRMGFHTSIMVDTSLSSLAQNLDAPDWPLKGEDETPAKYIDLSFEELQLVPGLNGFPDRIDQLIHILQETLAFDNPFGEMVDHTAAAEEQDNPLLKNLTKLEVPTAFPMEFAVVSDDTMEFCKLEKITTLGEFAHFAQSMPPQVIVGGDFRKLLNALAHVNEESLATILPFRVGSKGLHLPEALGQLVSRLPAAERLALFKRFGGHLKGDEEAQAAGVGREQLRQIEAGLRERTVRVIELFKTEMGELTALVNEGGSVERYLVVLEDPMIETVVLELLEPALRGTGPKAPEPEVPEKKSGLKGLFSRWFKK